jgi:hypothetical protein
MVATFGTGPFPELQILRFALDDTRSRAGPEGPIVFSTHDFSSLKAAAPSLFAAFRFRMMRAFYVGLWYPMSENPDMGHPLFLLHQVLGTRATCLCAVAEGGCFC